MNGNFWRCKCCKLVSYCNQTCQIADWSQHKTLCNAIRRETKHRNEESQDNSSETFMSHLTPKEHAKLIGLVGRRCTIMGKLNDKPVKVLWDTGAQVSIVSAKFIKDNFPNFMINDVSELLTCDLTLTAANGQSIPYMGWVELQLQIGESENTVSVPFLVTKENIELPLIGFNVIEHLIKTNKLNSDIISSNFSGLDVSCAPTLVELINNTSHAELCLVKTRKKDIIIPQEQSKISCRANTGTFDNPTPLLFEADENSEWPDGLSIADTLLIVKGGKSSEIEIDIRNTIKHDIRLKGRTILGRLKLVQSVLPVDVKLKGGLESRTSFQKKRT